MVNTKLNQTKQKEKDISVRSKAYISWIKMMLDKKVEKSKGFSSNVSRSKVNKKINRKDIENCKKLESFFDVIQDYAEKGYITRYYADGDFFSDVRYYIYFDGIIFVLKREISNCTLKIKVYEALEIDISSNWRDVIDFNDVIKNIYPDEIKFRKDFFDEILNDCNKIEKIKASTLYDSKNELLEEIKKTGQYKIPIKVILEFLQYVKSEM